MSELGPQYEVFQPRIPPYTWVYTFIAIVLLLVAMNTSGLAFSLFALGFIFTGIAAGRSLSRKFCGVWFHQNGVKIKTMGSLVPGGSEGFWFQNVEIPITALEDFRWDAQDVEQVEDGSLDRWQEITFLISWTDAADQFREIQFNESFEPGSISRLQRATPRLSEMAEEAENQDDYYDE